MYKSLQVSCTNFSSDKKSNFLVDKKKTVLLKKNVEKYKKLYYTRHNEIRVVYECELSENMLDDNEKKLSIYSWKMMSEICNSIYMLQKQIYETETETETETDI